MNTTMHSALSGSWRRTNNHFRRIRSLLLLGSLGDQIRGSKIVPMVAVLILLSLATGCWLGKGGGAFVVNSNGDGDDSSPGDRVCRTSLFSSECTLRAALEEANALAGTNSIHFNLPAAMPGSTTISPHTPLPEIQEAVNIDGTTQPGFDGGKPVVVLQGDEIAAPDVSGLTVREGIDATIQGLQILRFGGNGMVNHGTLTLNHMELARNKTSGLDSGVAHGLISVSIRNSAVTENVRAGISGINTLFTVDQTAVENNRFGGIWMNGGTLSLTGTAVRFNSTSSNGGGLMLSNSPTVNLSGVTIESNSADGAGGGIYLDFATATMTVQNSIIKNNQATDGGGAFIERGVAHLSGTSVIGNQASNNGGGVYVGDFTSPALHAVTALYVEHGSGIGQLGHGNVSDSDTDGHGDGGGIYSKGEFHMQGSWIGGNTGNGISNDTGSIEIEDGTIEDNTVMGLSSITSGATSSIQITRTNIRRNTRGGIYASNADLIFSDGSIRDNSGNGICMFGGTLELTHSTVSGNQGPSTNIGGGFSGNSMISAEIRDSAISGNSSTMGSGGIRWDSPGSILRLKNVTISGNRAAGPTGGGMEVVRGEAFLQNVTITGNTAPNAGGLFQTAAATVTITNSILEDNAGGNCGGPLTSLGHNLDSGTSCHFSWTGDIPGVSAMLGPLQNNGGATETHSLLPGSPALDAGDDATCLPADQRGVSRPQGLHCDIGAFELESPATATPPAGTTTSTPTPPPTLPTSTNTLPAATVTPKPTFTPARTTSTPKPTLPPASYKLEYLSGSGQTYRGGGMPNPMVFKIKNTTNGSYVNQTLAALGLSMVATASLGYQDAEFNNLNNYDGLGAEAYGGYYYVPPNTGPAYTLKVTVTLSLNGVPVDSYLITENITAGSQRATPTPTPPIKRTLTPIPKKQQIAFDPEEYADMPSSRGGQPGKVERLTI
jgi:CSLREA domain-containing protein